RGVAVRASNQGSLRQGQARSKGPLRARRGRPDEGEVVQGQGRARGRHAVRARSRAMSIQDRTESAPVRQAKSAGEDVGQSAAFEVLARAGFAARGLIYGIIGVLALKLAL